MREILGVLVPFFAIAAIGYAAARFKLVFSAAISSSTVKSVATLTLVVWLLARFLP